jgi:LPXTG-motif cell wall-anchored protein
VAATAIAVGFIGTATAANAATVSVPLDCTATLLDANNAKVPVDGNADNGNPPRDPQLADQTVNGPAQVEVGLPITFTLPSSPTKLPSTSTGFTIIQFTDIATSYKVTGGTITSPNVTFQVTPSGGVGSTVSVLPAGTTLTAHLQTIGRAQTDCLAPPSPLVPGAAPVLATTAVIAPPPPPPGAPDAINDVATTPKDTSVTIDVLLNDTKSSDGRDINTASLAIKTAPTNGTAVVTDGKVVYTPKSGYTGADSFQYTICSVVTEGDAPCDSATVSITVQSAQTAATPTTVAPATTPTTAAPAAAAELPKTGGSSTPIAVMAFAGIVGGLALMGLVRRPKHAR